MSSHIYPTELQLNKAKSFDTDPFFGPNEKVGYNMDIMRQSACLVINPITVVIAMVAALIAWWWVKHQTQ